MKRLTIATIITLVVMLILPFTALAINLPLSSPILTQTTVWQNVLETADRLFIFYIDIPYTSIPTVPINRTFTLELYDSDGTTVLGTTTANTYHSYGYIENVWTMYFDADAVTAKSIGWQPATKYTLKLKGLPPQFTAPPTYDFTIWDADYQPETTRADVQEGIRLTLIDIANDLYTQWDLTSATTLLSEDETGQFVNMAGSQFFHLAIPGVQAFAPRLFGMAVNRIDITNRVWDTTFEGDLDNQYAGTWVEDAKVAGAALFDTSVDLPSLVIFFCILVGVILANIYLCNEHWGGMVDSSFVLVVGARLSAIPLGYVAILCAVAVIYSASRLWHLGE
jgi:hypothetical protein